MATWYKCLVAEVFFPQYESFWKGFQICLRYLFCEMTRKKKKGSSWIAHNRSINNNIAQIPDLKSQVATSGRELVWGGRRLELESRSVMGKGQFLCSFPKWAGRTLGPRRDYWDKEPVCAGTGSMPIMHSFFFLVQALKAVHFQLFYSVLAYLLTPYFFNPTRSTMTHILT